MLALFPVFTDSCILIGILQKKMCSLLLSTAITTFVFLFNRPTLGVKSLQIKSGKSKSKLNNYTVIHN